MSAMAAQWMHIALFSDEDLHLISNYLLRGVVECVTCFSSSLFTFRHKTSCSHQLEGVLGRFTETWTRPCRRRRGSQREKIAIRRDGEVAESRGGEGEERWRVGGHRVSGGGALIFQCESSLAKTLLVPTRAALSERHVERAGLSFKRHNPAHLLHRSLCSQAQVHEGDNETASGCRCFVAMVTVTRRYALTSCFIRSCCVRLHVLEDCQGKTIRTCYFLK